MKTGRSLLEGDAFHNAPPQNKKRSDGRLSAFRLSSGLQDGLFERDALHRDRACHKDIFLIADLEDA